MRVLGLAVDIPASRRPALRAVLLEVQLPADGVAPLTDVTVATTFEVPSVKEDLATQLCELASAVTARVQTLTPDVVVVRRADISQRGAGGRNEGPRLRLLAEGAIIAAARALVVTHVRTGRECGLAYGARKEEVEADAATLVARAGAVSCCRPVRLPERRAGRQVAERVLTGWR